MIFHLLLPHEWNVSNCTTEFIVRMFVRLKKLVKQFLNYKFIATIYAKSIFDMIVPNNVSIYRLLFFDNYYYLFLIFISNFY